MKVENRDLIITDPCYISKDEDWGSVFNYDEYTINDPSFSQYEWEETGYGDGSPKVFSIPSYYNPEDFLKKMDNDYDLDINDLKNDLGECGVDSGSFGVFILDEVLEYNPILLKKLPKHCCYIIKNFTGIVYPGYDKSDYTHFILKPDNPKERPILTD